MEGGAEMARLGPVGVLIGVAVVIVGIVFQVAAMSAWVYCSVIGAGAVLIVVAGAIWLVYALRHRTPGALAT
jgi:hypothetical protein